MPTRAANSGNNFPKSAFFALMGPLAGHADKGGDSKPLRADPPRDAAPGGGGGWKAPPLASSESDLCRPGPGLGLSV